MQIQEVNFSAISVLLVDDDDYQRKVQQRMLSALGVQEIHEAASATQALDAIARLHHHIQVILCDLDMPGMDGMELLRLLGQQKSTASILVISGKHEGILRSVELMAKGYGLLVLGVLPKPATLPQLREKLLSHLHHPSDRRRRTPAALGAQEIALGLQRDEFLPYFQPKVELGSLRVCGIEALARWQHPQRGLLPPRSFIGVVEQHGLINELTWKMLEKTALQLRHWLDSGLDITVSLNFSQSSLTKPEFAKQVLDILERIDVPPEKFVMEITETTAMTDVGSSLENLSRLRMKGFGLSIDDFGTGHSSLQQLSMVPYTELKVDQMFVTGSSNRPHMRAVAESSVGIAKKLQLQSVAEGMETREDWLCLQQLGCDIGQGYYIAQPMPGAAVLDWARAWQMRKL